MKKILSEHEKNLQVLLAVHGSFNRAAKAMGFDPIYFNRSKWAPSPKMRRKIASSAQLIRLQAFVKLLRRKHNVSDEQARQLMRQACRKYENVEFPHKPT